MGCPNFSVRKVTCLIFKTVPQTNLSLQQPYKTLLKVEQPLLLLHGCILCRRCKCLRGLIPKVTSAGERAPASCEEENKPLSSRRCLPALFLTCILCVFVVWQPKLSQLQSNCACERDAVINLGLWRDYLQGLSIKLLFLQITSGELASSMLCLIHWLHG